MSESGPLIISDQKVLANIHELARLRGCTPHEAVRMAVEETLERERRKVALKEA
jgi:hypothetical protein